MESQILSNFQVFLLQKVQTWQQVSQILHEHFLASSLCINSNSNYKVRDYNQLVFIVIFFSYILVTLKTNIQPRIITSLSKRFLHLQNISRDANKKRAILLKKLAKNRGVFKFLQYIYEGAFLQRQLLNEIRLTIFAKKAPRQIFNRILNTSLQPVYNDRKEKEDENLPSVYLEC